jgi:hypothetical protein
VYGFLGYKTVWLEQKLDVSEKHNASIFRVKKPLSLLPVSADFFSWLILSL